jgi:hypothetical protein
VSFSLEVRRVRAAYDTLSKRDGAGQSEGTGGQADDAAAEDGPDPVRFVRAFLAESDVEILFDGSVRKRSDPRMAMSQADIEAFLSSEAVHMKWLTDEILLDLRSRRVKLRSRRWSAPCGT